MRFLSSAAPIASRGLDLLRGLRDRQPATERSLPKRADTRVDVPDVPLWNARIGGGEAPRLSRKLEVYVYPHTHRDRAWWDTVEGFRHRLVTDVDELLDTLKRDKSFKSFLLDAQTIALEDYLEIRPERRAELIRRVNEGRIQVGPWHVQPDQALISGEAHLRNLEVARRTAVALGVDPEKLMKVGYIPDAFGQISQMPQMLSIAGIDNAMIWRGFGGRPEDATTEMWWQSPDGSRVLAHTFAGGEAAQGGAGESSGYYRMALFKWFERSYERTRGRLRRSLDGTTPYLTTNIALEPIGGDHRPIMPELAKTIAEANKDLEGEAKLSWRKPEEYFEAIRARAPELGTLHGELRGTGPGKPLLLPGVLSTRMYLKQLNFEAQRALERYAEPLSALAWTSGGTYDEGFIWRAWKHLLETVPHDNICGCSTDHVHDESVPITRKAKQIAERLTLHALQEVASRIDTRFLGEEEQAVVVANSLPESRSDTVSLSLPRREKIDPATHALFDATTGEEVPFQVRQVNAHEVGMLDIPIDDSNLFARTELVFVAKDVPGMGHRAFRLAERAKDVGEAKTDLRAGDGVLENAHLRVNVNAENGTLELTDKRTGAIYRGLCAFRDGGDAGDTYNYSPPKEDHVVRSVESAAKVKVSVAERGPAEATLKIEVTWSLPDGLADHEARRSKRAVPTKMTTFVRLAAESDRVDVETVWNNRTKDHRLQMELPLGAAVAGSSAEAQFDVIDRPIGVPERGEGWREAPVDTYPQQAFVSVTGEGRGLTIANEGLPEFRVERDGTVLVTMLRSVGMLSKDWMPSRASGAGPSVETPGAQCLGEQRVKISIIPHAGSWQDARSNVAAHRAITPMVGTTTDAHEGSLAATSGLIRLEGVDSTREGDHSLVLSAFRKSGARDALEMRFWNSAKAPTAARVRLRETPVAVYATDLFGRRGDRIPIAPDGSFVVEAGGAKIVNLEVQFR
jgi:mannosylglycerate hydrolase